MAEINDGGPAFPRNYDSDGHNGMTLRDYFAAKAMQGMLGNQYIADCADTRTSKYVTEKAYAIADDMILARGEA